MTDESFWYLRKPCSCWGWVAWLMHALSIRQTGSPQPIIRNKFGTNGLPFDWCFGVPLLLLNRPAAFEGHDLHFTAYKDRPFIQWQPLSCWVRYVLVTVLTLLGTLCSGDGSYLAGYVMFWWRFLPCWVRYVLVTVLTLLGTLCSGDGSYLAGYVMFWWRFLPCWVRCVLVTVLALLGTLCSGDGSFTGESGAKKSR
jgi:hypothetical protein